MAGVFVVLGLGYGDEGKGKFTSYLTEKHKAKWNVRFNGGAQANHNISFNGKKHGFSQFGSGTFNGANTYLSKFMLVNPVLLQVEAHRLSSECGVLDPLSRMFVSEDALLTIPYHVIENQIQENKGRVKFGSCGMGIGETICYNQKGFGITFANLSLQKITDLRDKIESNLKEADLKIVDEFYKWTPQLVFDILSDVKNEIQIVDDGFLKCKMNSFDDFIFEGAQGTLLDEFVGFAPFTTWGRTTIDNVYDLLMSCLGNVSVFYKLGVLRTFQTRHGSGPLITEDSSLYDSLLSDEDNAIGVYQGNFRVGYFDLIAAKYAIEMNNGIDGLALSHVDKMHGQWGDWKLCVGYEKDNLIFDKIPKSINTSCDYSSHVSNFLFNCKPHYRCFNNFIKDLEENLDLEVVLKSFGKESMNTKGNIKK